MNGFYDDSTYNYIPRNYTLVDMMLALDEHFASFVCKKSNPKSSSFLL